MDLLNSFKQNWKRVHPQPVLRPVLLAVSGGMDSMTMAHLFICAGIPAAIAHCNFSLRGEDSVLDEALVRTFAQEHGLPFHGIRFDTKEKMAEWKKGVQETARILRYEWLEAIRTEHGYSLTATAHHANDNVETMLVNLFKGTGIAGMHGILPRSGTLVRPLLFATRDQVSEYASARQLTFREDASNQTDAYQRNRVRHHIIPAIETRFPGAVTQMNDTIGRLSQAEILYRKAVGAEIKNLAEQRGRDLYIPIRKLMQATPLETICYELLSAFGFTPAQVPGVLQLIHAGSGHFVSSSSHRVIRNRDFLVITALSERDTDMILVESAPCQVQAQDADFRFSIRDNPGALSADPGIAMLDLQKITFPLILRRWRSGDYFYPLGMGMKKKKLSRFFIDRKLPLHEKEQVWILESGKRIVWVSGMQIDERFKISPGTTKVLEVIQRKTG